MLRTVALERTGEPSSTWRADLELMNAFKAMNLSLPATALPPTASAGAHGGNGSSRSSASGRGVAAASSSSAGTPGYHSDGDETPDEPRIVATMPRRH